ncbi:hypothetical protein POUND7_007533 [Theobroma cacao]
MELLNVAPVRLGLVRGVHRDSEGGIKMQFSKSTGWGDVNMSELLAVREAFLLFTASTWVSSHNLVIESDSINMVKWIRDPWTVPWHFRNIMFQIKNISSKVINWEMFH